MKTKDYEPIKFQLFQSEMERIMFLLNAAIEEFEEQQNPLATELKSIFYSLQCKIDRHIEKGEWK